MNINYSALTRSVSKSDIQELRSMPEYARTFWSSNMTGAIIGGLLTTGILIAPIFAPIFNGTANLQTLLIYLIIIAIGATVGSFIMQFSRQKNDVRLYRNVYFANENNFLYGKGTTVPSHPGLIFHEGHSQGFGDILAGVIGNTNFEMGNFFYTTGSGKNQQSHDWGYLMIPLKNHVPNMVLDAKSNNIGIFGVGITNLPVAFRNNQTLSLEGDFDKYFTLYAPEEYKRDALYVFTPDLMALLIDNTATFDVEIINDRLYIYSSKQLDLLNPALLEKLFKIITTVGVKTLSQTDSYVDERAIGSMQGSVAEPGRRLKKSYTKTIITTLFFVVVYVLFAIF